MSKFEFLMMIASVVVAVGMTEIVGGWGRLARTPASVRFDWLHLGWTIYILLYAIQYWIGMWSYQQLEIGYVGQIYFLVIPTIFIVLAAYVITPDVPLDAELDVRSYYWRKRRVVFLSLATFSVAAWMADLVIAGVDSLEINFMILSILTAASMVLLAFSSRSWIHWLVLGISFLLLIVNFFTPLSFQDARWIES